MLGLKQCMEKIERGVKGCVNNDQLCLQTPPQVAHINHLDQLQMKCIIIIRVIMNTNSVT